MRAFSALALLAAVAAIAPAGVATAGDQARQPAAASSGRAVLICGTDAATRRAFAREHGATPVFVTAREALAVRPSDPAWSPPRCMTAREHARLVEATTTYAAVR